MKSQKCLLLSLFAGSLIPAGAVAEWYAGGGVFYAVAEGTAIYDSNIFTNSAEEDSFIFLVSPGIQYIRDAGVVRLEAEAGVVFSYYSTDSDFNSEDPFVELSVLMPFRDEDYPLALRGKAAYIEEVLPDPTVGQRVERSKADIETRADYRFHQYFVGWGAAGYENYDYSANSPGSGLPGAPSTFGNSEVFDVELGGAYRYSANLNVGLSGRLRWTEHDLWDSTDYAVFAVAEGRILPRTTGTIRVGAQHRSFDSSAIEDQWSPYVSVELEWEADENTTWVLAVVSDYQPTSANESVQSRAVSLSLRQQLVAKIDGYVSVVLERLELDDPASTGGERNDDVGRVVVGANYTLTELVSLNGNVSYESRDSTSSFASFDRVVAQIGLRARF